MEEKISGNYTKGMQIQELEAKVRALTEELATTRELYEESKRNEEEAK